MSSSSGPSATPMPVPSSYSSSYNGSGNRMQDLMNSITIFTKILLGFNIAVEIIIFLFSIDIGVFAISSYQVLYKYEFYRIVSAAFVHVGLLHIAMNMSSLFQIGPYLEQQFGTIQFFFLTIWSVFAIGFIYVFSGWLLYMMSGEMYFMFSSGVGFSGVLFTYAVIEAFHTTETTRSVFGLFSVPAKVYPFILLILLQIIIPGISFLGHVSGCIVGLLVVSGAMDICLPSADFLETVESQSWMGPLKHSASYVPCTGASLMHSSSSSTWSSIISGGSYICMGFLSIIEAICHILNCPVQPMKERCKSCYMAIFHRGSRSTSSTFTNSSGSTGSGTGTGTNTTTRGRTLHGSVAGEVNEDEDERGQVQFSNNIGIRNPLLGRVGGQGYQPVSTNDTSNDVESPKGNIANV